MVSAVQSNIISFLLFPIKLNSSQYKDKTFLLYAKTCLTKLVRQARNFILSYICNTSVDGLLRR